MDIPHLQLGQGFVLHKPGSTETILGLGQFDPEPEYASIVRVSGITQTTRRNACFIIMPHDNGITVLYFKTLSETLGDNFDENKEKIMRTIKKQIAFSVLLNQNVIVYLDTPDKAVFQNRISNSMGQYHQDMAPRTFLPDNIQQLIKSNIYSKYTIIEYRTNCVSTTIKNPFDLDNDIIRFWACPGTVACIEDQEQQHTSPYTVQANPFIIGTHSSYVDRAAGNAALQLQYDAFSSHQTDSSYRPLYRTQITPIDNITLRNISTQLQQNKDFMLFQLDWNDINNLRQTATFPPIDLSTYLAGSRSQEAGKLMKPKSKRNPLKSKRNPLKSRHNILKSTRRIKRKRGTSYKH